MTEPRVVTLLSEGRPEVTEETEGCKTRGVSSVTRGNFTFSLGGRVRI